jgi:hypothetical protein
MARFDDEDDITWWMPFSKCSGMPAEFFFPIMRDKKGNPVLGGEDGAAEQPDLAGIKKAKRFCNGQDNTGRFIDGEECPVRMECLHYAIWIEQWEGIFGGMVERERRSYARRKKGLIGFGGGITPPTRPREIRKPSSI